MTKKEIRHSLNVVLDTVENLKCEQLHHKTKQQHEPDEVCPAEYELYGHCNNVREYFKEVLNG